MILNIIIDYMLDNVLLFAILDSRKEVLKLNITLSGIAKRLSDYLLPQEKNALLKTEKEIAELKLSVNYEREIKNRFNKQLHLIENCLDSSSPSIVTLGVKIRNIIDQ